jgi:hypothetical protein
MNAFEINNLLDPKRHILAIACGILGGVLPNIKSNIHPYLIGAFVAGFVVKMIYGDYDKGYSWTLSDIVFWTITLLEGVLGAFLITSF